MKFKNIINYDESPHSCEGCGKLTQRESIEQSMGVSYLICSTDCLLSVVNDEWDGSKVWHRVNA